MYTSNDESYTIISNDCWSWYVYQKLGHIYTSPFIGTLIIENCYIKLLKNLKYYLNCSLEFVEYSKYPGVNTNRINKNNFYPIGILDGEIEIHFFHETDRIEANSKWNRRLKRINWNNLFIKFSDGSKVRNDYGYQLLAEFEKLEFKRKVCFTAYQYPEFTSTIFLPDMLINGRLDFLLSEKKFNIYGWIRQEKGNNLNKYLIC